MTNQTLWHYPAGSLDALIASDAVTVPTRSAIVMRETIAHRARYFDDEMFALLIAVAARLVPWPDLARPVAAAIDARLAAGEGDGWRYAELPVDGTAYRDVLQAIDVDGFLKVGPEGQDECLRRVQARGDTKRGFEELLAEVAEAAFTQPSALERIGYTGLADARGWHAIGLDEREPHEAVEHG